ncbi:unnamed protein product, partial [Polarella glacialis]
MASNTQGKPRVPSSIANGKFEIGKKLGAGCFGEVFRAVISDSKTEIAVKFEDISNNAPQLEHEAAMLNLLRNPIQPQGFAEFYHFGKEGGFHVLAMEYLGKSLEDRVQECSGKFTPKTACLVASQ